MTQPGPITTLGLQSISRDVAHNASHPRRLDPTMELIKYSFVLYLQHGRHDVQCKPSTRRIALARIYRWFRLCINPDCASLTLKECVSYACHSCSLSGLNYKKHAGLNAQFAYALSCLFCTCMRFYSRQTAWSMGN